jgi:hypothetical protein
LNIGDVSNILFTFEARTTEDDYRCRELDDDFEVNVTSKHNLPDSVKDYIRNHVEVDCPHGKYPEIEVDGFLKEISVDYDSDRGRGYCEYQGYVWIYVE